MLHGRFKSSFLQSGGGNACPASLARRVLVARKALWKLKSFTNEAVVLVITQCPLYEPETILSSHPPCQSPIPTERAPRGLYHTTPFQSTTLASPCQHDTVSATGIL